MELYTTSKPELQGAFPKKLDIVNDPDFKEAINAIFAMCTKIKKKREGAVVDRTSIVDQILKKKYFIQLIGCRRTTRKCLLTICGIFVTVGGKTLRELKISYFSNGTDAKGRQSEISQGTKKTEITKNIQGGRMYELKDCIFCPYGSFLFYINKLNRDLDVLLQRPSKRNDVV